jgi:membrane-bound lytic murein transglycosylase B
MFRFTKKYFSEAKVLKPYLMFVVVMLLGSINFQALGIELDQQPKLKVIAEQLVAEGHYSQEELEAVFAKAEVKQSILDAMQNPAEYKFTWGKYRKLFLQQDRIQQGVDFWLEYEPHFERAEKEYGVPASVIAAIIGVESKFGKYKGKHRVLDSLVTLVVGFERRSKFFAGELKEFLVLCKANELAIQEVMGSYAGAVGFPQFISSSYRAYAVDFSGDGKTDLIDQPIDAIGSIANYFVENGWRTGQPVASLAFDDVPDNVAELASRKRKVKHTAEALRALGAAIGDAVPNQEKLGVLELNASEIVPESTSSNSYIVRAGDTACQIAEKHKVTCKSLFSINKLNKRGSIFRGQKLTIPSSGTTPKKSTVSKSDKVDSGKWVVGQKNNKATVASDGGDLHSQPKFFYTHENIYVITR